MIEMEEPSLHTDEYHYSEHHIVIQREGSDRNLVEIRITPESWVPGPFKSTKMLTIEDINMINREIERGTFPKEMGILLGKTPLRREELDILNNLREQGELSEIKKIPTRD